MMSLIVSLDSDALGPESGLIKWLVKCLRKHKKFRMTASNIVIVLRAIVLLDTILPKRGLLRAHRRRPDRADAFVMPHYMPSRV